MRVPSRDAACKKLYKFSNLPHAYVFKGSIWHTRVAKVAAAGCKRSDNGPRTTPACCP